MRFMKVLSERLESAGMLLTKFLSRPTQRYCLMAAMKRAPLRMAGPQLSSSPMTSSMDSSLY